MQFCVKTRAFCNPKESLYRLVDHYTIFYCKFREHINESNENWWCSHLDAAEVLSWMGIAFELICIEHHKQIKKALEIGGVATSVYTWKCEPEKNGESGGAQIDMIIERADRILHICEIKFSRNEYVITKQYEESLRKRLSIFQKRTGFKFAMLNTFITTYGVLDGIHKSIVDSEITMDDLFNS